MSQGIEIRRVQPGVVWIVLAATRRSPERVEARSVVDLARQLDVTRQTVLRWARGARIPRTVELALRALAFGEVLHDQWAGWCVDSEGRLWAPNGPGSRTGFLPTEIEWWTHVFDTNRLLWRRLREIDGAPESSDPLEEDGRAAWMQRSHLAGAG